MARFHLVTGATGHLGSNLVLALLAEPETRVVCLARPYGDEAAARERVLRALERAADASGQERLLTAARWRVRTVAGDLTEPRCGVALQRVGPVSRIWHAAASLRFEAEAELQRHNVEGTRNALGLAHVLGVERFNLVSTAYVAGTAQGRIPEVLPTLDAEVNNPYERSKIAAEHAVVRSGVAYRILRPGILIGHSATSRPGSVSGFCAGVRTMVGVNRALKRRKPLGLPAASDPVNLIPVDVVARNALAIDQSASTQRIFHLTNAEPPCVAAVAAAIHRCLASRGLDPASIGRSERVFTGRVEGAIRFFLSHLVGAKEFALDHTDEAIGRQASRWPLGVEALARFIESYLAELGEGECR